MNFSHLYNLPEMVSVSVDKERRLVYVTFRADTYFCKKKFAVGCFDFNHYIVGEHTYKTDRLGWFHVADTLHGLYMTHEEAMPTDKEVLM